MVFRYIILLAGLLNLNYSLRAQNNPELQKMADADQQERAVSKIDWKTLNCEDSLRRVRVLELIKYGGVQTGQDHLNAGIIFQHGNDTISSAMAVKSFETAIKLDSTLNRWWYAAAVDRDLMRRKKPQVYGTQFIQDRDSGKWKRYEIDSTKVTDAQRGYYYVETLAAQREKEWRMNLKPISETYKKNKSIEETIESIREQNRKGRLSSYSLKEEINQFGYELMTNNKDEEALRIFKLNTELYPDSFNTYDSYGEILMKMGKKKAAVKAYKHSLELNPDNENARQIIQLNKR